MDLIVALNRKEQGLWIPNNETKTWDASDPEYHTQALTADPSGLRRIRAKVIRLAKGWNSQYSQPSLSSFNIEALALTCIGEGYEVADGLTALFRYAASDLKKRLTPDPAGLSKPIKALTDRDTAIKRLRRAGESLKKALEDDDDKTKVRDAVAKVYWKYVGDRAEDESKAAFASAIGSGGPMIRVSNGALSLGSVGTTLTKTTRSYGGGPC